jgi:HSP20 family protein
MAYMRFYNPYFSAFRDQHSDSAYDQWNSRFGGSSCGCAGVPAANITEGETSYQIEMALPGVGKDKINIKYENGTLTVSVAKPEQEGAEDKFDHQEFDYSGTSRVFRTGDKVDSDNITAKFENGVLTITLPKKEAFVKKPAQNITIS